MIKMCYCKQDYKDLNSFTIFKKGSFYEYDIQIQIMIKVFIQMIILVLKILKY